MIIECPRCHNKCEVSVPPEPGRHLLCPFCGDKFVYDDRGTTLHADEVFESMCPNCQTLYEMENGMEGTMEKCDVCGKSFVVKRRDGGCADIGTKHENDGVGNKNDPVQRRLIVSGKAIRRTVSIMPRHRFCQECGNKLNPRAVVCPKCGVPVQDRAMGKSSPIDLLNPPPNHLVGAILVTLFCCLPVGVAAIVFAIIVNTCLASGDVKGARTASRTAGILINVALICGVVLFGISIVSWLVSTAANR